MGKAIFFNIPAHGHTNPTLALVRELIDQGEEVLYYSFPDLKEKIEETGATYMPYSIERLEDTNYTEEQLKYFPIVFRVCIESTATMLEFLLNEVDREKPDYIIHDSLATWGKYVGQIKQIPTICSTTTFPFHESFLNMPKEFFNLILQFARGDLKHLVKALSIQHRLCKKYNIKKPPLLDALASKEKLNIVYTAAEFTPNGDVFDDTYCFAGPSISDRGEGEKVTLPISEKPVVYISLGSIFGENKKFYEDCFHAFKDIEATFVLSLGNKMKETDFSFVPENFILYDFVNQIDLLQKVDIFVTHGGMNSAQEGLYFKVPLILYPQQQEQEMIAQQVERLGCGIHLKECNSDTLKQSLLKLLNNEEYKQRSEEFGTLLQEKGGYKRAAVEIMSFYKQKV
ncbi:macrolide family glycosyltransferase [Metabacillus niabensis]|uniref:MGT family glycosyltransferase n=1 Tax=Metabacillus niabensis TaxID=324854 RepID=A0ABT9YXW1_9BACI|nr:macrolide family glycosyltransferase [Metabacillus niabensis]MDQ0224451.1 MGT family glycosyltransferase [Metabacillus niabensis]